MKVTSIQFVFDNGAVVTFIKGSKEVYTGNDERWRGKHYFYTVRIENKFGGFEVPTFASPSQVVAKTFLTNSLKPQAV